MTENTRQERTKAAREASIAARRRRQEDRYADLLRERGWVCIADAGITGFVGCSDGTMTYTVLACPTRAE